MYASDQSRWRYGHISAGVRTDMVRFLVFVSLLPTTGCYFMYPKLPDTLRPQVVDGEEVSIESSDHQYMAKCDPTHETKCGLTSKGEFRKPDSYVTVTATYNGRELTQWELRRLVDPKFEDKLASIRAHKGACNVSFVPSMIAGLGLLALTVVAPFYEKLGEDTAIKVGWGAAGAAVGGGLLSIPMGGFACRAAHNELKAMFEGVSTDDKEFLLTEDIRGDKGNEGYVREMLVLTSRFNHQFGHKTPTVDTPKAESSEPQ